MGNWILIVSLIGFTIYNGAMCHRSRNIQAVTYNAAMKNIFDDDGLLSDKEQRRGRLIETLNHIKADIVCLQGVWWAEDVAAIVHGVRRKFKYSFSKVHMGKRVEAFQNALGGPVCDLDALDDILGCIMGGCSAITTVTNLFVCLTSCISEFRSNPIDENCITCILTAVPNELNLLDRCIGGEFDGPLIRSNPNGLLLLSKKKLSNTRVEDYFPFTKEMEVNGFLSADVGGLQVVCTKLTSDSHPLYLEGFLQQPFGFNSYTDQNAYETALLISRLRNSQKLLLLGDFGSGPASTGGVIAKFEDNYNVLAAQFNTTVLSQCTFCSQDENLYNGEEDNFTVDHVFVRGLCIRRVKRLFTPRDVSVLYQSQMVPLSDHFGVGANIAPVRACERLNHRG